VTSRSPTDAAPSRSFLRPNAATGPARSTIRADSGLREAEQHHWHERRPGQQRRQAALLLELGGGSPLFARESTWYSSLEEFRNLFHKLFVILEDAAVSCVTIEGSEFGSWQTLSQVDSITAGRHSVVLTVDDQDRLLNARQVGRLLTPPSMDGLELPTERGEGNRPVAIVGTFLQSLQELSSCKPAICCSGKEEIVTSDL